MSQNREYETMTDTELEEESIIDNLIDESLAEANDDVIMDAGVWHTIAFQANENGTSLLVSFKFFFQLTEAIDHDATIKHIMDTVYAIRDEDGHIGFKEALGPCLGKTKLFDVENAEG